MVKLKRPKRLITTTILMALILLIIIEMIIGLINEKSRIQEALNLSQQNRELLLRTEGVTESLLMVEAKFKEYCVTFDTKVFNEYKAHVLSLAENIKLLQQTKSDKTSGKENQIAKIIDEKNREAEVYLHLKQIADSLMSSVSNLEQIQAGIEKSYMVRSSSKIDTLSVTETRQTYKKGLFGKIKSAIVGEKINQKVNTKVQVESPTEKLLKSEFGGNSVDAPNNIKELIKKNFELKESELKMIFINNNLIAEIRKLIDDIKISIKNQEASHNKMFLNSVRHSTDFLQSILIALMILACLLAVYILFLAYRNDKFQDNIMALNQQVIKDSVAKDKFFSIISHDLMNPFHVLLGFVNILNSAVKKNDQKEIEECSEVVHQSVSRISNLLQNLLVWSRMNNGKVQFSPKLTRIEELVSNTLMVMASVAQNKEIKLTWKVDEDITATLDSNMISSVLQNLVTNAIKFTQKGGEVNVSVFCESEKLNVVVSDSGVGMSDEQIQKLFVLDKNASSRGTDNEAGTGLGLIISKEFIDMHQGRIWAESTLGKGSKFCFQIPESA